MKYKSVISLLLYVAQLSRVTGTRFASHVSVNTPARSFTHGVGDPLPTKRYQGFRTYRRPPPRPHAPRGGYPRVKPTIPFNGEEVVNRFNSPPWQFDVHKETAMPVLPPSPYRVDSPDPESLWPEGLFLPPVNPRFNFGRRTSEQGITDPYLLEGSEAIAAVKKASDHGLYFFHDIPHIESLLANQDLRVENNLEPHRIASIRHTWPYNRP